MKYRKRGLLRGKHRSPIPERLFAYTQTIERLYPNVNSNIFKTLKVWKMG